jgi:hypothetical protein
MTRNPNRRWVWIIIVLLAIIVAQVIIGAVDRDAAETRSQANRERQDCQAELIGKAVGSSLRAQGALVDALSAPAVPPGVVPGTPEFDASTRGKAVAAGRQAVHDGRKPAKKLIDLGRYC